MTAPPLYPLPGDRALTRRSFLAGSASFAAAALLRSNGRGAVVASPRWLAYPFSLGVASGDPAPDGMVLWTRLAPQPLEPGGGMPDEPVEVAWQVADNEAMTRLVQQGTTLATRAWAHSVHIEVTGLRPDRWYWYRFKAGSEVSPIARTRTLPAVNAATGRLRFVFASCQKYEVGHYTAFEHMRREDIDLVVHLGDYIYEKGDGTNPVRPHGLPEAKTLDAYRARYALYKGDPALQAVHALAPWIVTWDDHEVSNNYASEIYEGSDPSTPAQFLLRRAAAYQAYYEHMPLRRSALPHGPEMLLYRRLEYGQLAAFHVLDTRQYRSDQIGLERSQPPLPALSDPNRTMLGERQRQWLFDGLDRSAATWNVLAQQIMMARVDFTPGPGESYVVDKWMGYEHERRRVLTHLRERKIRNPIVITGDIHSNWANEIPAQFDRPDAPPDVVEFVGTSISSVGDSKDRPDYIAALQAENPGVKFHNEERGYVRCEVTPKLWRTDFQTVAYVSRKGAPLVTRASFVVEAGRSRLARA